MVRHAALSCHNTAWSATPTGFTSWSAPPTSYIRARSSP
ncbi:hypothetical protein I546_4788 [Mycobacterium kansasii 732]|nr:hypothetical protein I546_4788 [Mycobacterium kansasii 732]